MSYRSTGSGGCDEPKRQVVAGNRAFSTFRRRNPGAIHGRPRGCYFSRGSRRSPWSDSAEEKNIGDLRWRIGCIASRRLVTDGGEPSEPPRGRRWNHSAFVFDLDGHVAVVCHWPEWTGGRSRSLNRRTCATRVMSPNARCCSQLPVVWDGTEAHIHPIYNLTPPLLRRNWPFFREI